MDEEKEYYSLTKAVFKILAPIYDVFTLPISKLRDKVVEFSNARNSSKVLDICTGTGQQAFAFAKRGYDVIGVDLSEDMLKVANKNNKYKNAKFEVGDATCLHFDNNSFDVSCVSFALHDMPFSIRQRALKEIIRVTKPKGIIVVVDYALPENKVGKFLIYHLVKLYEGRYYSEFIKSDFEALLKASGLEMKEKLTVLRGFGIVLRGMKIGD
jgi:demethylmenaquinone methyltransferase/2-methoxy-6-polyprenyl-1,4-benzoquinol methylase